MSVEHREQWSTPSQELSLEPPAVHVWRLGLKGSQETIRRLRTLLSPDELARVDRFHFDHDREAFVARRGALRILLSCYAQAQAATLRFDYNAYHKPSLRNETRCQNGADAKRIHSSPSQLIIDEKHSHSLSCSS